MTFEQEIKAIDELAQSFRSREQVNIELTDEISTLKEDKAALVATLESLTAVSKRDEADLYKIRDKYETEVRNNGELKATLKQLLAEQMALASRAAEMLLSLEEKPTPVIEKAESIKIAKPTFSSDLKDAQGKDQEERFLEAHVLRTLESISEVPAGETFILDAPYGERVTDWILKKWYRRILGKAPSNFKDAPSVELLKQVNGAWEFLRQVPKPTNAKQEGSFSNMYRPREEGKLSEEGREPLPFRTEEANTESNGATSDAFTDNGEDVPGFLKKGPNYDHQDGGRA